MSAVFLTDEDRSKIDRIATAMFTQQCALAQTPKMAAGVVADGEILSFSGHQATPNSLFRIASMTKSFTAAAVLLLRDEGQLRLDEPIATYAPEFAELSGPTADAPALTARLLLTMAGGLGTDDPWGDRHLDISDDEFDAVVSGGPIFGKQPGTGFEYSNLGYGILGRLIHRITGIRPQELITERLLSPLGMSHTVWESHQAPTGTDVVIGTRSDNLTPEIIPLDGGLATMGGLWSTVTDLAKWVEFFADAFPPRDDDERFPLKRSSRREMQGMHTFHQPLHHLASDGAPVTTSGGYGMGLLLQHDRVLGEIVGHSGGLPGYGSNMRWVKGSPFGVVALGNATYTPMATATRRVLDALSAAKVVRRPARPVSDDLRSGGASLFALLSNWSTVAAEALFADNVAPDEDFTMRALNATQLFSAHGDCRLARVESTSNAAGRLIIQAVSGELVIDFSLAPVSKVGAPRIQAYQLPKK